MLETVCTRRKTIRIAGDDYPAELVKAKFMKLDAEHIRFVLDCMKENTTKIRNIKQYLRAVLFNAPSTIGNYYTSSLWLTTWQAAHLPHRSPRPLFIQTGRKPVTTHNHPKGEDFIMAQKMRRSIEYLTSAQTATAFALTSSYYGGGCIAGLFRRVHTRQVEADPY